MGEVGIRFTWVGMMYNGKCPCPAVLPTAWECWIVFLSSSPPCPAVEEQSHAVGTKKFLMDLPFA